MGANRSGPKPGQFGGREHGSDAMLIRGEKRNRKVGGLLGSGTSLQRLVPVMEEPRSQEPDSKSCLVPSGDMPSGRQVGPADNQRLGR